MSSAATDSRHPATASHGAEAGAVLDRAGKGAWADMWRVAPPLTAVAFILNRLRLRPTPAWTTPAAAQRNQ